MSLRNSWAQSPASRWLLPRWAASFRTPPSTTSRPRRGHLELASGERRGEVPHERGVARQGRRAASPAHQLLRVGGNTKFYGAALFRLRKEDFGEIAHHGGLSPAWPISYDELEPYYLKAEKLYHVHGKRGEEHTDPQESVPLPHPAIRHDPIHLHI